MESKLPVAPYSSLSSSLSLFPSHSPSLYMMLLPLLGLLFLLINTLSFFRAQYKEYYFSSFPHSLLELFSNRFNHYFFIVPSDLSLNTSSKMCHCILSAGLPALLHYEDFEKRNHVNICLSSGPDTILST